MSLFSTGVRPVVDAYLEAEASKVRSYGEYWSASSAGYCMRKVIFQRLKVPPVSAADPRKQRVFSAGHIFHNWIQEITQKAGISVAQEVELQDEDLMVRGHFDDLLLIEDKLMLVDYKTVNSRSFMWTKKNGSTMSYYHKMQLGTYMYMLRQKNWLARRATKYDLEPKRAPANTKELTEARILKIEKDNLMMEEQQLLWGTDLEVEVRTYWMDLRKAWLDYQETGSLPNCTCADHENGFLAKEAYNDYFFEGEPCSLQYFNQWKETN